MATPGSFRIGERVARPWRKGAAALLALALLPVAAPASAALAVSNTGQSQSGSTTFGNGNHAQSFSTGSHSDGYKLTRADLTVRRIGTAPTYTVSIHSDSASGPGTSLGTLTNPSGLPTGWTTPSQFAAPDDGIDLNAGSKYWVVVEVTANHTSLQLALTNSGAEDSGGLAGWSIDGRRFRSSSSWDPANNFWQMAIQATEVDSTKPTLVAARLLGIELTLTYDEALGAAASLANNAFTVKKTDVDGDVSTVGLSTSAAPSVSGSAVVLTLAAALDADDRSVKVSYAKPSTGTANKIVDLAGNEADGFTDEAVARVAVSNLGQTTDRVEWLPTVESSQWSQQFTTGPNRTGYALEGVDVDFDESPSEGDRSLLRMLVYGDGGRTNVTLAPPSSLRGGQSAVLTFTAPEGTTLAPGTEYSVEWGRTDRSIKSIGTINRTVSGEEDSGGLAGWSLNDRSRNNSGTGWVYIGGAGTKNPLKIGVHGHQLPNPIASAVVDDSTLTLTFNKDLNPGSLPAPGAFLVTVDDSRRQVAERGVGSFNGLNGLRVLPRQLLLTLASAVDSGETVKMRYDKPASNPLKDTDGNDITPFNNYPVTNNSKPTLLNAGIRPGDRTKLRLVFDEPLDESSEPASSAFSVTVAGTARALASGDAVAMDGNLVTLTLSSAAASGSAVTVGYTKPSTAASRLKDALGNEADAFTSQTVKIDNANAPASSRAGATINAVADTLVSLRFNWTQFTDADGDPLTLSWRANRYDVFRRSQTQTPDVNAQVSRLFVEHASACTVMNLDPQVVPGSHTTTLTMKAADPYGESTSVGLNFTFTGSAQDCPALTGTPGVRGVALALVYEGVSDANVRGLSASDFTVTVDGTAVTPTAVSVGTKSSSGATRTTPVTLTLPSRVRRGQTVTVRHAAPANPGTVGFADRAATWSGGPPTATPANAGDLTQTAPPGERREVTLTLADPDIDSTDLVVIPSGGTSTDPENTLTVTVSSNRPEALAEWGYDTAAGKAFLKVKDALGLCALDPRPPATFTSTVTVTVTDIDGESVSKDIVGTTNWSESACGPTLAAASGARPYVAGRSLTMTFNKALDETAGAKPAAGDFAVTVGGDARQVTGVNVKGSTVTLTLASPAAEGETVTVSYTAGTNRLRFADGTGEPGEGFSGQSVANFTGEVPTLSTAAVNGVTLTLTYDEALDEASEPATGDFEVTVDGDAWTVDEVDVVGSAVTLTLDPAVSAREVVKVGYEAGTNPIRGTLRHDAVRFDAANFSGRTVTNNSPDIHPPEFSSLTVQGTALTITYNEPLDQDEDHVPPTSHFPVTVDGKTRNVLEVEVTERRVTLTLSDPAVSSGQNVGVTYTAQEANDPNSGRGIRDLAGNWAKAFGPFAATYGPPPSASATSPGRTCTFRGGSPRSA